MKKIILAVSISSCFLFACNTSNDPANSEANGTGDSAMLNSSPGGTGTSVQMPSTGVGGTTMDPSAVTTTSPATGTTAAGMNPPHGEPGHRCEIAVGAPLNSEPSSAPATNQVITMPAPSPSASPVTPTISPTITPTVPSGTTAPVKTAAGMNPPHGEPGHDCAIAVGAPLKK